MEPLTVILLLFGTFTFNAANNPVYKAVGDTVVLTPASAVDPSANPRAPIKGILWNHGPDIAVDWYGGEPSYYSHFKGRSALNISTGALTITGLTRNDRGSYKAEINDKDNDPTQLLVISPVSKPTISTRCDAEMTHCVFTCEGSTTGAEPVTYQWHISDYVLTSTKTHNITKEEKERSFQCILKNPVSFNSSDTVQNPFTSNWKWILPVIISLLILVVVVGVIVTLCVLFRRCKKGHADITPDGQAANGTPDGQAANGTPDENLKMLPVSQEPPVDEEAANAEVQ